MEEIVYLVTNVGFPVALCFILLRYVLQTIGEKLDRLDKSLNTLTKVIREFEQKATKEQKPVRTTRERNG
ncbi:YvrJ protein family protein [compost metagenome]